MKIKTLKKLIWWNVCLLVFIFIINHLGFLIIATVPRKIFNLLKGGQNGEAF